MSPGEIDARLRELGIPHEHVARSGDEPEFVYVYENGVKRNWYSTAPIAIMMLKTDVSTMQFMRPLATITIELG